MKTDEWGLSPVCSIKQAMATYQPERHFNDTL